MKNWHILAICGAAFFVVWLVRAAYDRGLQDAPELAAAERESARLFQALSGEQEFPAVTTREEACDIFFGIAETVTDRNRMDDLIGRE